MGGDELAENELIKGRYRIEREIGTGGMGRVFAARDTQLDRDVAIKVLRGGGELANARFLREARAAGSLRHPNVLTVFDVSSSEGEPFLVCELLQGETLRDLLSRRRLDPEEALRLEAQLFSGLAAAHESGVVHRDLKPENVFVTREGQLKLLDFGIAKLTDCSDGVPPTDDGTVLGTIGYMPPEQVLANPADERSDIFSAGVMLYEMLCGQRPFQGGSRHEIEEKTLRSQPQPLPPGVSPSVARFVDRCLQKEPSHRFATARDAANALAKLDLRPRSNRSMLLIAISIAAALIGPVAVRMRTNAAPPPSPASIAVLPFVDLSPGKDQQFFADGMTEEVLQALSKMDGLRVAGRTSSFAFRGKAEDARAIGAELGVATLLEGSVRKSGTRVRVSAHLLAAADGAQLWGQDYDREPSDVLAVQSEIANAVAAALRPKLLSQKAPP